MRVKEVGGLSVKGVKSSKSLKIMIGGEIDTARGKIGDPKQWWKVN